VRSISNPKILTIEGGNLELVKLILNEYPELVESRSVIGWSPAMFASRYGHIEVLRYLYREKGAQMQFEKGSGCLHAACYGGDHETLTFLFEEAKVSPNPDSIDRTPLLISLSMNVSTGLK
jgi:ankyrin repeat protein